MIIVVSMITVLMVIFIMLIIFWFVFVMQVRAISPVIGNDHFWPTVKIIVAVYNRKVTCANPLTAIYIHILGIIHVIISIDVGKIVIPFLNSNRRSPGWGANIYINGYLRF